MTLDPASAQLRHPFYGELALALPTAHGAGLGAAATFGASFLRRRGLTLSGQIRASAYDTGTELPGADGRDGEVFSPVTLGLDARVHRHRLFVGASLDAAQLDAATDETASTTRLAYALETGVDLSRRLYGVVRYQATFADDPAYRALTIGVGYRF